MVGILAICAQQDEIADIAFDIFGLRPLQRVLPVQGTGLSTQPPGARQLSRLQAIATGSGITARTVGRQGGIGQLAPRAGTRKSSVQADQLIQGLPIKVEALTLIFDRTIPFETERIKLMQDGISGTGYRTRRIDILDPQQPAPSVAPCFQA